MIKSCCSTAFDWLVKNRYWIFLGLFILCLIFRISGSSIGEYNKFFTEKIDDSVSEQIFGESRAIRSDEYLVLTPYYFSQSANDFQKISYQMSLDGQNMIIGYNAPLWDFTTISKPLNWGYLLFGQEVGLSWYWCMKLLLIFAFAFECMMIFTKKHKILSVLGAFLIALGPATQWWFAPHMPDVILWGMALFAAIYHFITTKKRWVQNTLMCLIPLCVMQFVIAIFPSFQVGFGIFIAVFLILLIFRDKIKLFPDQKQIIRITITTLASIGLVLLFIFTNLDALKAIMGTDYPGARVYAGGDASFSDLLTDVTTPFLAYKTNLTYSNPSEASTYIHFGIFFLLIAPALIYRLKKEKRRNYIIGIGFVVLLTVYGLFMVVGFPEWLAKISLFSQINRMKMIFGLVAVFFTIWSLSAMWRLRKSVNVWYYMVCIILYCSLLVASLNPARLAYLPIYIYSIEIAGYGVILICFRAKKIKYLGVVGLFCVTVFSSICINPVITGASPLKNHPSVQEVQKISEEDNQSYWIGTNGIISSYLLANGAKTLNAVNFYPDWTKWQVLDPNNENRSYYNRYAHINFKVSSDGQKLEMSNTAEDSVTSTVTLSQLSEMNVKYIMSDQELKITSLKYNLQQIYQDADIHIYQIN